ncbi:GNAT family N-acetyltransferase [Thalassotalea sp. G2M2-11]|uniref:GNAT family N-acetyltransferase n=1 Tax=Thalassotalea sp. G2M2-11 TaxID=2787627 RepID=UPI0019D19280|nr:GNAT family N-acetyltransferase [Thalassotalea sp. G2M2-11]
MKTIITFRRAQHEDIAFLLNLRKQSMDNHLANAGLNLTDQQHKDRIMEFFNDSFIINKNAQPIGLIKIAHLAERIHIRQFQLMPDCHNQGIGGQVLSLLQQKAQERDLFITLNVLLKNPALRLYQRYGFVVEGKNELEYQMRWQPANS